MATSLDSKEIISFEELLMSQVVQQEAFTRLLHRGGRCACWPEFLFHATTKR